ncbi:MAG: histidinol-phosphate aminotransferase family protein [Candidatus Bathyarchaeota archaeon]|nr:histidinol-phosphate aminotransferase family protein [Candidatus Bathyarchaeota archaeon]
METPMLNFAEKEKVTWFSMWFLASVASFGAAFFPMFYRLVENRNRHFRREAELEKRIVEFLKSQGKEPPRTAGEPREMNAKVWAASIILIIPVFVLMYYLTRDLVVHEKHQDTFLADAFPERMFMTQTIPITKYALITIATLGIGGIYWLYKIVNSYNAHFGAQWKIEQEITRLMEDTRLESPCKKKRFVSHGGDVWGFSRKYNIPLEKVRDFSGPINYLGPSPKAVEAIREYAKLVRFYPDPDPVSFREEIASYIGHGVGADNIILGNGSIELIYMVAEYFQCKFKAVIPVPSFSEYEKAVLRVGGDVIFVQLPSNFALELENIKKAITDDTKIVYICNPHSPSGTLYTRDTLLELTEFCQKKGIIVSVDENYIEFTEKGQDTTLAGYAQKYDNLFIIRSVTKFYGMPGIRFGYAIASEKLIDQLQTVRQPWSINSLANYATSAAFKDTEFIQTTRNTLAVEKAQFAKNILEIGGYHVYPSETNFLLVKITSPKITSTELREQLAKDGLLIRDCCTFVGLDNTYFRVTVRSAKDNLKLVQALKEKIRA